MSKPVSIPNLFSAVTTASTVNLDADFTALANSINDLSTYSNYLVDSSGAPNSITVATAAGLTAAYTAGLKLDVKLANTNTATAVTLNVNALGTQAVVNSDGTLPAIGQLIAGQIVSLLYDGTAFRLPSVASSGITTGLFGNGSAANPGIAFQLYPHTGIYQPGSNAIGFAVAGVSAGTISNLGNWTIPAPPSGNALMVTGSPGNRGLTIQGDTTLGSSFGFNMNAGTNATDQAFIIRNAVNTSTLMTLAGDGGLIVGNVVPGGSQGPGTINCNAIYVNGVALTVP